MRYAIISDIHGNLHALEVVLKDIQIQAPDKIICLGDLVGYGAYPDEVVERVRDVSDIVLAGNHDHAAVGLADVTAFNQFAYRAVVWTKDNLSVDNLEYLSKRPFSYEEDDLFFVHASPMEPEKWYYVFSDLDAEQAMTYCPGSACFIGHTHLPKDHKTRNGRLINVGSVGQPRDGDPRSAYTIYESGTGERKLIRLDYDIKSACKAIKKAGLPTFLADRLLAGR